MIDVKLIYTYTNNLNVQVVIVGVYTMLLKGDKLTKLHYLFYCINQVEPPTFDLNIR